jgi:predicted DNA-binding transcriptional regulator AlpA
MMTMNATDLISVDDAAEAYKLSRATIFRLIGDDRLKSFKKLGDKRTLVSKAALKRLLVPEEKE